MRLVSSGNDVEKQFAGMASRCSPRGAAVRSRQGELCNTVRRVLAATGPQKESRLPRAFEIAVDKACGRLRNGVSVQRCFRFSELLRRESGVRSLA